MSSGSRNVFWGSDPNVLFQAAEFFPTGSMSMKRQLNAITRLIIVLAIALFSIYQKVHYLIIGALTVGCIWVVHHYYVQPMNTRKEMFDNQNSSADTAVSEEASELFQRPTPTNPFGNVLLTDIVDNPKRLPAPPASNPIVMDEIMQNTKQMIANQYPNSPNIVDRMFGDMSEQMALEQSMRQWISNPVTTIPGESLAAYCYGNTAAYKDSLKTLV